MTKAERYKEMLIKIRHKNGNAAHLEAFVKQEIKFMSTHSTDGREWAKLSTLKAGDKVTLDDGFTCGLNGKTLVVEKTSRGDLCVPCEEGSHTLDGQLADDGDHLVGVWPA